jgi:hypothetical protein
MVLTAELRTRSKLLLDALKELGDLGSESGNRAPDTVHRARRLVNEILRTFGFRDGWPTLGPVAQGIVDPDGEDPPMTARYRHIPLATLCCLLTLSRVRVSVVGTHMGSNMVKLGA